MGHILYKDLNYHSNVIKWSWRIFVKFRQNRHSRTWQTKKWKALFDIQNMLRTFTQHVSHIFSYSDLRREYLYNLTPFCCLIPGKRDCAAILPARAVTFIPDKFTRKPHGPFMPYWHLTIPEELNWLIRGSQRIVLVNYQSGLFSDW